MPERRIVTIERPDGYLKPFVRPGRRRGAFIWFDEVPEGLAIGASANFEIERERKKGAKWRVVRRAGG